MVDNHENPPSELTSKQEEQPPAYQAPIVTDQVIRSTLEIFAAFPQTTQLYRDKARLNYALEGEDSDKEHGRAAITLQDGKEGSSTLKVGSTPTTGSGISVSISGPTSEWALAQDVDDQSLLTELVYNSQSVLQVVGPPAKLQSSGIKVEADMGDKVLIDEQYRI
jgi:hypothetical protein